MKAEYLGPDGSFSRIVAGTMSWGAWGKDLSATDMITLMNHCLDLGINTFDHADIYGGYTNEAAFGQAFSQSGISRDRMRLITKCGIQYVCDARGNRVKHYDYSKDYIVASTEQSLRNLHTDYVDMLLLHRPSPLMEPHEIAEAVLSLQKTGKIRYFGLSNFTPSQVALIAGVLPVLANQVEISLTTRNSLYDGTLDDCLAHGRWAMSWSPLGSYFRQNHEAEDRIRSVMQVLCPKYEASEMQILLAWLLRHPAGISPVTGTTDKERLRESQSALTIHLELEDWFELLTAAQGHKVP